MFNENENDKEQKDNKDNKDNHDNVSNKGSDLIIDNPKVKVEWSPENELIMVEWCDVAQCYKWLNSRSHGKYSYMHAWFTIPAIIFSTISGTASFATSSIPEEYQAYAPVIIGSINITIGILTTIQQYLKISELNEAHRVSSISWDKFSRNIRIELSKHPNERTDAKTFIKVCRQEYDRLMETSPDITESVIGEFTKKFSGPENSKKRKQFDQLKKPDICDTIVSANETRHKWYLEDKDIIITDDDDHGKNAMIQEQQRKLAQKEKEIEAFSVMEKEKMDKQIHKMKESRKQVEQADQFYKSQIELINKYISSFQELYERKPLADEIIENIGNQVDDHALKKFLSSYGNIDNV